MRQMARNRQRCFKLEEHAEFIVYTCLHNTLRGPSFALMPNTVDEFIQGQLGGFLEASLFVCLLLTFL